MAVTFVLGFALVPLLAAGEHLCIERRWWSRSYVEMVFGRPSWMNDLVFLGLGLALLLSLGMFAGAVTRDVMLRWRVRRILRKRGRCAGCNYFLGGLPVGEDLRVTCPECGFVTEVDVSLGELRKGDDGAVRFEPSEKTIKASNPWLTPARLWRWTKRTAFVIALIALVAGVAAGWNELRIRRQAERAAAAKPGAAALNALAERVLPSELPAQPSDAYELMKPLLMKMGQAEQAAMPDGLPTIEGVNIYVDGTAIATRPDPQETEQNAKERAINQQVQLKVLAEYRKAGVFEDARALANADTAMVQVKMAQEDLLLTRTALGNLQMFRRLARWEAARMRLAVGGDGRVDDPAEFAAALDNVLGYAYLCEQQPTMIGRLVADALEALAYSEIRGALQERHDARWLDAMEGVLKKRSRHMPRGFVFEAERLFSKDAICWVFADPGMTRWGRYTPRLATVLNSTLGVSIQDVEGRLGTLEENLAAVDALYDCAVLYAQQARMSRTPQPALTSDLVLVKQLNAVVPNAFNAFDKAEIDRVATPLLIALERYRLEHGSYPAKLEELAPKFVGSLPLDPWTSKPFGYKRVDSAVDPQKRGFLLYSYGSDLTDNGGNSGQYAWEALHGAGANGLDMIINDVTR
ncbi:MAG: hypothetical protein QM783_15570 [Phycisphaerales bacterium]